MKVLVTGAGGFLGRAVVRRLLEKGDEVRGLGRTAQPELEKQGVRFICADLADSEAVRRAARGADAVVHTAAKAGVWGPYAEYFRANVTGTRSVIEACRAEGVGLLVHTSTPSVVFTGRDIEGGDESLPLGRHFPCAYAATKALAEREALAADKPGELAVCALRPHLIFGRGDPHLLPRVVAAAQAGRLRIVGNGRNRVDVTHVESAALAHVLALDALAAGRAHGKAYFVSQGEPVLLWPWLNSIFERLGIAPLQKRIPAGAAKAAGALAEILWKALPLAGEPPMTRFAASELATSHWFDISAARRDLGYSPALSTEEGLADWIAEWRARPV